RSDPGQEGSNRDYLRKPEPISNRVSKENCLVWCRQAHSPADRSYACPITRRVSAIVYDIIWRCLFGRNAVSDFVNLRCGVGSRAKVLLCQDPPMSNQTCCVDRLFGFSEVSHDCLRQMKG